MCLSVVTDREPKPEETGVGWKVIVLHRGYWDFDKRKYSSDNKFCGPYFRQQYNLGEWVKATSQAEDGGTIYPNYPIGFHLFPDEKDAKIYLERFVKPGGCSGYEVVVQVEYKGVLCRGDTRITNDDIQCLDWNLHTLVVENIRISS